MKKALPQISTFKKALVILTILFSVELLILTLMSLYDITYLQGQPTSQTKATIPTSSDIKADTITISSNNLDELDILPSSYDTLKTQFGAFSPNELTTFLRYAAVLKTGSQNTITEGYSYLLTSNTNILIPQVYIDQYLTNKILNISQQLEQENKNNTDLVPYIKISEDSTLLKALNLCIQTNLEKYLNGEACTDELIKITDEDFAPTLSFLAQSLKYTPYSDSNDYQKYISNNQYIYALNHPSSTESEQNTNTNYNNNVYLDLNSEHLRKLTLILNYINLISQNLKVSSDTTKDIENLSQIIAELSQYEYGQEIPQEIKNLIYDDALNIVPASIEYAKANPTISYLIKCISSDNTVETFVSPMYTFTGSDQNPLSSLSFEINDQNFEEPYDVTPATQARGTVRIPIFMYHRIEPVPVGQDKFKTGLYVDPVDFEKQMAYLVKKNYKTINSLEYYNLLKAGKNPVQKTVMITFDDGSLGQYTTAYPILKKYGLTAVFYIISQRSGINGTQAREMSDNGMEIGSHSARHPDLTKVTDPAQLSSEIISSKYALQSATGKTVSSFCYPGCGYNATVLSYVGSAGYITATSCGSKIDNYPAHAYTLSRVHAFGDMQSFKNLLSGVH